MQWRWLTWLVLPLAAGGALWLSTPHPLEWKVQSEGECTPVPFALEHPQPPNRDQGGLVLMASSGAYIGEICEAGRLTFQARGDQGQGRGPRIQIYNADQIVFQGELSKQNRAYSFAVAPGPIIFNFEDDYAGSEGDRNVWLSDVRVRE